MTCWPWPTGCGVARCPPAEIHPLSPRPGWPRWPTASRSSPRSPTCRPSTPTTACFWWTPGAPSWPGEIHRTLRTWSPARLHTAVYSHGHIDHVFGVPVWAAESSDAGWPAPEVVAHEALPARFDRYILTAGYNAVINRRQFDIESLQWPTEYRYPDRTYRDHLELDIGGMRAELHHAKGETDDHTWTWLPEQRVLCCGDLFIWASPNAGNPQKVQRYPVEWADGPPRDAGPLRLPRRRARGPPARPRLSGGGGRPGPPGPRRHRRAARVAGGPDPRPHEQRGPPRRGHPHRHPAGPPDGAALPPTGLRRARVHRPDRVAPLRGLVGRQSGHPQAGPGAGPGPASWPIWPAGPGCWPTGPWPLAWPRPRAGTPEGPAMPGTPTDLLRLAGHLAELAWLAAPDDPGVQAVRRRSSPAGPRPPRRPWPTGCSRGPPGSPVKAPDDQPS